MAYIKVTNVTSSSISVRVAGLTAGYSYDGRLALFSITGKSEKEYIQIPAYAQQTPTVTFTGLSAATEYTIKCTISGIVGTDDVTLSKTQSTTEGGLPYIKSVKRDSNNLYKAVVTYYLPYGWEENFPYQTLDGLFLVFWSDNYNGGQSYISGDISYDGVLTGDASISVSLPTNGEWCFALSYINAAERVIPYTVLDAIEYAKIISAERHADDPWKVSVTFKYDVAYDDDASEQEVILLSRYWNETDQQYYTDDELVLTDYNDGNTYTVEMYLRHIGENRIEFGRIISYYDDGDPEEWYSDESIGGVRIIEPVPITCSIDDTDFSFCGRINWTISGFATQMVLGSTSTKLYFYVDDEQVGSKSYTSIEGLNLSREQSIDLSDKLGNTVELKCEIVYNNDVVISITQTYTVSSYCETSHSTGIDSVWRDDENPERIYITAHITSDYPPFYVKVETKFDGGTREVLAEYDDIASSTFTLSFDNMGTEKRWFYLSIGKRSYYYSGDWCIIEAYTPPAITSWTWSDSNGSASQAETINAYNAIDLKLNTTEFSYLVWNDLVEKVREAYRLKNGGENTVYEQYLNDALMNENDEVNGKVLLATRFNNVRKVIGGVLSTFNVDDNAIYDHYENTANWDMQSGEKVLGEYIKALTTKLNEGIE